MKLQKALLIISFLAMSATAYAETENNESNNTVNVNGDTTVVHGEVSAAGVTVTTNPSDDQKQPQVNSIDVDQSGGSNHTSNNTLSVDGDTTVVGNAQVNSINVKQ